MDPTDGQNVNPARSIRRFRVSPDAPGGGAAMANAAPDRADRGRYRSVHDLEMTTYVRTFSRSYRIVTISSYTCRQRSSRTRATQRRGTTSRNVYKKAQHAMTRRHVASRAFLRRCGPGLVASTRYQAATTHTNAMCLCMWAWVCTDSRLQSTQHHLGRPRIH